jgi:hypothetical protein
MVSLLKSEAKGVFTFKKSEANSPIMEFCMMFHHALNDKLEIYPLPRNTTMLSSKAGGKEVGTAINYLGKKGWKIDNVINLKKVKMMQWTFKRPFSGREMTEYCIIYCHGSGDKIEVFPPHPHTSLPIGEKTYGDDLVKILNILGASGWTVNQTIPLKKTKIMQWILERSHIPE